MEKENIIFGIRAIIEAIQAGTAVDKVFIQKEIAGELMKDLMKVMKRANINFSYVPVEKLNRLTPNNHQGAVASISPIGFMELEHLVESTMESGKQPLFLILVFNVPICKVEHIKDAIFYLQGSGIKTIAATEKTEQNIYDIALNEPVAIIMGSEDRGINPSVLKIVDEKAKLPMFGTIGSLNVSVACGAFLYEAVRQRS
jgi:23S rRNA (guanosine2251-2'-O)-methyltransferase